MFYLLALWVMWLIIAALLLRWIVGGFIDCLKHGSEAGLVSWMGCVIGILILVIICAATN